MKDIVYEYEPYLSRDGSEVPCFRIYIDGEAVAQTNEDLPIGIQEKVASLFASLEINSLYEVTPKCKI